ncbi:alpha/beta-hydrolase [Hymenopellis radicata]|nr:alpha/beta-hydrolase [Hymenopellis radicata]
MGSLPPVQYVPPSTRWGSPTSATHRAICLHGLTSSSQVWCGIAERLAEEGYALTAPDLLGHGLGRRPAPDASYSVHAYAEDIMPLLCQEQNALPYDTVLGHSYGGAIALVLAPLMLAAGAPFVHVVLVEPALELDATQLEGMRIGSIDEVTRVRTWEKYMEENPRWGERDARAKTFGAGLCWPETADETCKQNNPWSFTHLMPPPSPRIRVTILAADPGLEPYFTPHETAAMNRTRPDVRTIVIPNCSHGMPREVPEAVVQHVLAVRRAWSPDIHGQTPAVSNEDATMEECDVASLQKTVAAHGVGRKRHPAFAVGSS